MAVDVNWPSEDEDFDAVTDAKPSRRASTSTIKRAAPVAAHPPKPRRVTSVAVSSDDDEPALQQKQQYDEDDLSEDEVAAINADYQEEPDHRQYNEAVDPERYEEQQLEAPELQIDEQDQRPEEQQPEERHVPAPVAVAPTKVKKEKPPKAPKQPRQGGNSIGRTLFELTLILAIVGLGLYVYKLASDRSELQKQIVKLNNNPQEAIQQQTQNLITRVGQLITLPKDETPTVANVSDAAKAREQSAFFNNAQNGDKVLMYVKSGQAILYRPATDKIILVAPLTFNDNPAAPTTSTTQQNNTTTNKAVTGTTTNGVTSTNNR